MRREDREKEQGRRNDEERQERELNGEKSRGKWTGEAGKDEKNDELDTRARRREKGRRERE